MKYNGDRYMIMFDKEKAGPCCRLFYCQFNEDPIKPVKKGEFE